jgi:hypothetical protein
MTLCIMKLSLRLLTGLILSANLFASCKDTNHYPSFAGTYELVSQEIRGSENWPFRPQFPSSLEVTQDVFRNQNGRNHLILALESIDPDIEGALGVFDFSDSREWNQILLGPERWDDVTSPLVDGFSQGYRCHYRLSGGVGIWISPEPSALNRLYPYTDAQGITPAPWNSDQLRKPDLESWRAQGPPRITLSFHAGKYNDEYPAYPCDRVVAGRHTVRLTYERVYALESVDLRLDAPPALTQRLTELRRAPNILTEIYPLPDDPYDLIEIFGR